MSFIKFQPKLNYLAQFKNLYRILSALVYQLKIAVFEKNDFEVS